MFFRKIYLTIYHFRWTVLFLLIGGIVSVYFKIDTLGTYILAAFMGWLQAFIDKVREIGHQLEIEHQAEEEASLAKPTTTSRTIHQTTERRPTVGELLINWAAIFEKGKKTFIVLGGFFLAIVTVAFIYLYLYF